MLENIRAMADSDIAAADAVQDDFESASQVASSQRNFPSWDASTSVTEQWSAVDSQKLAGCVILINAHHGFLA